MVNLHRSLIHFSRFTRLFIRQHQINLARIAGGDHLRAAQVTLDLGRLAREDVTLERRAAQDLPGAALLEPLRSALVRLQLLLLGHNYSFTTASAASFVLGFGAPFLPVRIVCIWLPS